MTHHTSLRRPSDDLDVLLDQLLRELETLRAETGDAGTAGGETGVAGNDDRGRRDRISFRSYLRHALALAWKGVADGDAGLPRAVLDRLLAVQPFVDDHFPETASPAAAAAYEIHFAIRTLYLADEALGTAKVEARLAERGKSLSEREVLRVLWANREQYLVRAEVHKQLSPLSRPTPGRVGQILADLYHDKLLLRIRGQAQGNPQAAFYTLSPQGRELCRRLGLDHEGSILFPVEKDVLDRYLTPERIARRKGTTGISEPGRIVAFHAHRGGVGRTTAVAHGAHVLASRLLGGGGQVLVADLDFDAPGLDDFFAPRGLGQCRGLRGLVVDFHRLPAASRSAWLREALTSPDYVLRPSPRELSNIFYLPNGFAPVAEERTAHERAEALARLRQEAGLQSSPRTRETMGTGFLSQLRTALRQVFAKTFLDSQAGLGVAAWIATQVLADDLVLFTRFTDVNPGGLRTVLANFLRRCEKESIESQARVAFAFAPSVAAPTEIPAQWIERHLMCPHPSGQYDYRTSKLTYDRRISRSSSAVDAVERYGPLVDLLESESEPLPSIESVVNALCGEKSPYVRRIAEGLVMSCNNHLVTHEIIEKSKKTIHHEQETSIQDLVNRVALSQQVMNLGGVRTYR